MKKSNKILSIFLSVLIFFSFLLPNTAQAKTDYKISPIDWTIRYDGNKYISKSGYDYYTSGSIKQGSLGSVTLTFSVLGDIVSETNLSFSAVIYAARYSYADIYIGMTDSDGDVIFEEFFYSVKTSNSTFTLSDISVDRNSKNVAYVAVVFSNFKYAVSSDENLGIYWGFKSINLSYENKSTGLLNSIIEWIKGIFQKLVSLPSEIGSFITSLGEKISSFFSDLFGKLGAWFSSIGDWFEELGNNIKEWFNSLGDRISGFFNNLWSNISGFFTDIKLEVENAFKSVVEFFKSLVTVPDGYFDEYLERVNEWFSSHFGIIWQAPELIISLVTDLYNSISNSSSTNSAIIVIPEIRIPYYDVVLLPNTSYDLMTLINSNDFIKWVYNTFRVISSAFIYLAVINFCVNTYQEFIKNRGDGGE